MSIKGNKAGRVAVCIIAAAIVIALIMLNVDFGAPMENLLPQDIERVTGVICAGGEADSGEIDLHALLDTYQTTGQDHMIYRKGLRSVHGGAPETGDCVLVRFTYKDGRERVLRLSEDDRWDYFEEPDVGTWRKRKSQNDADYRYWRKLCTNAEFDQAFAQPLQDGGTPTLTSDYTGGEKAVWIDWSQEISDHLYMQPSWRDTFGRTTPEGYVPERARDVRWLFIKTRTGHAYQGYWYEVGTGRHLGNSYNNSYEVMVYDLVTGEGKVLAEGDNRDTDIGDCMAEYLGLAEK